MSKFPNYKQPDSKDCGPTCLRIVAKYYGKSITVTSLRKLTNTTREGSSLLSLADASEEIGLRSTGLKINFQTFRDECKMPCIIHWQNDHFVVPFRIQGNFVHLSDPAQGLIKLSKDSFLEGWIGANADDTTKEGVTLLLEPTPKFFQQEWESASGYSFFFGMNISYDNSSATHNVMRMLHRIPIARPEILITE